ncbi:MAG: orotidine-5'-phosphate decarboxylase [Bacteroidetes bacterium]|nr:orotidine-5'-phosphate decarboxylase [Bacteroidota bacterium]
MNRNQLIQSIRDKKSYLCIGLDTDLNKIPPHLLDNEDPVFEFNKQIIDSTKKYCVAYKPNTAFYEAYGSKGWQSLEKTIAYIGDSHFIIADAKRGDIGNTSQRYAEAFFKTMQADAITVAPYMGSDSVTPFFMDDKWVILLALTSNTGSNDFQMQISEGKKLFEQVILRSQQWGTPENLMYVVGATHPNVFQHIRRFAPDHFLLVPGVGAQGGDLKAISEHGLNKDCGLLVNSSRNIIYASNGIDFAEKASLAASEIQQVMEVLLRSKKIIL